MNGRFFIGGVVAALAIVCTGGLAFSQTFGHAETSGPAKNGTPAWHLQGSFPDPGGNTIVDNEGHVTVPPREPRAPRAETLRCRSGCALLEQARSYARDKGSLWWRAYLAAFLPPGAKIEIGVRPEFVNVAMPAPGLLSAQIDRIDDLGRARFARLRVGDVKFAARVPVGFAVPADQVGLIFDTSHVHVYADSHLVEGAP